MLNPFSEINWNPDRSERREFARSLMAGFPLLALLFFAVVRWKTGMWAHWPIWMGCCGLAAGALLWIAPQLARPIYVAWHAIGGVFGFVISNLLLVLVFYLVITPIGVLLRLAGKDPLDRRLDRSAATYWKDAEKPVDARRYFRQF